jgi:large subunit ribosomal protein L14
MPPLCLVFILSFDTFDRLCQLGIRRADGSSLKFDKNACVVLDQDLKPRGSRVLYPLPRELRNTVYSKLLFLSDVIL